ncbi:YcnI family protein [uncultured Friedmanniella sp.]|uniref:YcnI family copper-binding membrane protein n=1 Tax=uncultured Friedmanniella sp. TaxID=335381 RepID=UPI0035CBA624
MFIPTASRFRLPLRLTATAAAAGLLVLTGPALADAHVRVAADSTTAGAFSALTFRVPNESDTAGTVKLTVQLPQDKPFLYVSSKPVPGWTVTTTEQKLPEPMKMEGTTITKAPRTVTWTAAKDSAIEPGQYQEFSLSVGPLPAAGSDLLLPATQTYSDGTVVMWDEPTPASGEEPEHPAPELMVTAPAPASPAPSGTGTVTLTRAGGSDGVARGLGVAALVVAVAGLAVALLRGRRRTA